MKKWKTVLKTVLILLLITCWLGVIMAGERIYIFKPQKTKGAIKTLYIDTDGNLKAKNLNDTVLYIGYLNTSGSFTASDLTPSVTGYTNFWMSATTGTVSNFDNGIEGQEISLLTQSSTTFAMGSNIKGLVRDLVAPANSSLKLRKKGSYWYVTAYNPAGNYAYSVSDTIVAFTKGDATPSVRGYKKFVVPNTVLITDFDDGLPGQDIVVLTKTQCSFTTGNHIIGGSGTRLIVGAGSAVRLLNYNTYWYIVSIRNTSTSY